MAKSLKKKCCYKFERKGKSCSRCPLMACLAKAERKQLKQKLKKLRKQKKAA